MSCSTPLIRKDPTQVSKLGLWLVTRKGGEARSGYLRVEHLWYLTGSPERWTVAGAPGGVAWLERTVRARRWDSKDGIVDELCCDLVSAYARSCFGVPVCQSPESWGPFRVHRNATDWRSGKPLDTILYGRRGPGGHVTVRLYCLGILLKV
jgi:hypothetical protein